MGPGAPADPLPPGSPGVTTERPLHEGGIPLSGAAELKALPLLREGHDEEILLAWRGIADGAIHLVILAPASGTFTELAPVTRKTAASFSIAIGGTTAAPRIFLAWIESTPWRLTLAVVDTSGTVLTPAHDIGQAVNVAGIGLAGTETGAIVAHAWSDDPANPSSWDPFVTHVDLDGKVIASERVASVAQQTLATNLVAFHDGSFGVVWVTKDQAWLRRYGQGRALEAPVFVESGYFRGDLWMKAVASTGSLRHRVWLGLPLTSDVDAGDISLRRADLAGGATIEGLGTVGARSTTLSLPVRGVDVADGPAGPVLVAVWQNVLARDPDYIGCLEPPPIELELLAMRAPMAGGAAAPASVLHWKAPEKNARPPADLHLVPTAPGSDRFTVLWTDRGLLHFRQFPIATP